MRIQFLIVLCALIALAGCSQPSTSDEDGGSETGRVTKPNEQGKQKGANSNEPPPNLKVGLDVGMIAPEIEGEDIDGQVFKLSDYRGKVVVLDFWGNW